MSAASTYDQQIVNILTARDRSIDGASREILPKLFAAASDLEHLARVQAIATLEGRSGAAKRINDFINHIVEDFPNRYQDVPLEAVELLQDED